MTGAGRPDGSSWGWWGRRSRGRSSRLGQPTPRSGGRGQLGQDGDSKDQMGWGKDGGLGH